LSGRNGNPEEPRQPKRYLLSGMEGTTKSFEIDLSLGETKWQTFSSWKIRSSA
jgi:hypothetical protein